VDHLKRNDNMKLRFALCLAATLAFAMPVCATPTYDETPLADFTQLPDATDLQDSLEDENAGLTGAREERSTSEPSSDNTPSPTIAFASLAATAIDPVPEPSTALLLAPVAAAFLLSRRRK
jgi:hypothetical protein